jgi:hypothetical protein
MQTGTQVAASPTQQTSGSLGFLFRAKSPTSNVKPVPVLTKGIQQALLGADALVASYNKLKVDVLDRSDRALWQMLQEVYTYVDQVERSTLKRETRMELIKAIQQRDQQGVSVNTSTEAIVARYVFVGQSRQSRSNYSIAMEKARAIGIANDKFAEFLEQYGGVSKVVEKVFDFEAEEQADAEELAKSIKEEKDRRTNLVERLLTVMAHQPEALIDYKGQISNWVPQKPAEKATKEGEADKKSSPKFEKGRFVLFVSVHNPETGKYHMVQGNVFDRSFEEQFVASIAERMDVDTDDLSKTVLQMEQAVGFSQANTQEKGVAA